MRTREFKTRTIFNKRKNPSIEGKWSLAIDIGFSAMKVFCPNGCFSFPSYAFKMDENPMSLGQTNDSDIFYKNLETGEMWCVGSLAQDLMKIDDTRDSISTLYNRHRYFSPMFQVITSVGLALGLTDNEFGSAKGKDICVQTGLPPAYLKSDSNDLKESIAGNYHFMLKIGKNDWKEYSFAISMFNIQIMAQPMGTLFSISVDKNGNFTTESQKYFNSNTLICDPGFGTLDTFDIKSGIVDSYETFDFLGMKRVMKETSDRIFKEYNIEIPVPAMQKYLTSGNVSFLDKKTMKSKYYSFENILLDSNQKICMEAIEKIKSTYNYLIDHQYFIITGGTGAAWSPYVREHFKDMQTLTIVSGNQNDDLPYIFSNVRGYYMYAYNKLKK